MPKLQAIMPEMLLIAETIQKKAGELLAGQRRVTAIAGGMKQDFSGALPNLMLDQLVSMGDQYDAMYHALVGYAKGLALAVEKYNATDEAIAKNIRAAMAAMGIGLSGLAAGVVVTDAPVQAFTTDAPVQVFTTDAPAPQTVRPVSGKINQMPGQQNAVNIGGAHKGIDYAANKNDPIAAPVSGKIVEDNSEVKNFGNYVVIEDAAGNRYYLAHMSRTETHGSTVTAGDIIGYAGSTGRSTGTHLHMEIRLPPYSWTHNQAPANMYDPYL